VPPPAQVQKLKIFDYLVRVSLCFYDLALYPGPFGGHGTRLYSTTLLITLSYACARSISSGGIPSPPDFCDAVFLTTTPPKDNNKN